MAGCIGPFLGIAPNHGTVQAHFPSIIMGSTGKSVLDNA